MMPPLDNITHSRNLIPIDGSLFYFQNFFSIEKSDHYFRILRESTRWRADKIRLFGKEHDIPRLQAWYGDPGIFYTYSGIKLEPNTWTQSMLEIRYMIENHFNKTFNSVLLNYYRSGKDYVSWHSDNEPELGLQPYIASLSLGGIRNFQLKHRSNKNLGLINLTLEPGSLVVMSDTLQENWIHRIAPTKKSCDPRINLTFRKVIN